MSDFATVPAVQPAPVPTATTPQNSGFDLNKYRKAGTKGIELDPNTPLNAVKTAIEKAGGKFGSRGLDAKVLPEGTEILSCVALENTKVCYSEKKETFYLSTRVQIEAVPKDGTAPKKFSANVLHDADDASVVSFAKGAPMSVKIVHRPDNVNPQLMRANLELAA